jgi:hypothetical protein
MGVQIGINDVWQAGPTCGDRCSNVSEFARVLSDEILRPALALNIRAYLASVSTIGEQANGTNEYDAQLDLFEAAARQVAASLSIPFVDLRAADVAYENANNCEDVRDGVLTYDGVHPNARGAMNLANLHAGGLWAAAAGANGTYPPLPPRPVPGGNSTASFRLFLTSSAYDLNLGGISGADKICTQEAGGKAAKALLVDEPGFGSCGASSPCRRATVTPFAGDGQVDWPLAPNATYYFDDAQQVLAGLTGPNALFAFPLFSPSALPCVNQASGMQSDWTTQAGGTCFGWTRGSGQGSPANQSIGWSCSADDGILFGGASDWACSSNKFLCVTV